MCLSASLSEKEDMSVAGLLAACSKLLKGTLRVYTTSSDSSGLSFDTPGWDDTHRNQTHFLEGQMVSNWSLQFILITIYSIWWFYRQKCELSSPSHQTKSTVVRTTAAMINLMVLYPPSCPLSVSWVYLQHGWPPRLRSWGLKSWRSTPPPPHDPSSPLPGFYF